MGLRIRSHYQKVPPGGCAWNELRVGAGPAQVLGAVPVQRVSRGSSRGVQAMAEMPQVQPLIPQLGRWPLGRSYALQAAPHANLLLPVGLLDWLQLLRAQLG